jgi:hypothetical protein
VAALMGRTCVPQVQSISVTSANSEHADPLSPEATTRHFLCESAFSLVFHIRSNFPSWFPGTAGSRDSEVHRSATSDRGQRLCPPLTLVETFGWET